MIRKLAIFTIGFFALSSLLLVIAPSQDAQAQCTKSYDGLIVDATGCATYPAGGLGGSITPTATPTPRPTSSAVVSADTVDATTGGSGSGGASIAFTGSESRALGYTGAGLIGFGAIALAIARRKSDSDLD